MKKWVILNKQTTDNLPAQAGRKQITEEDLIRILLKNRGITKKKEIEEFLHPALLHLTYEKAGLKKKELDKAVSRIKYAIDHNESIIVYTDYDVDGLGSGAIVWETLYGLGAKVMPYVPNRMEEGYGLSKKGIDFIFQQYKTNLIVTVDHGVTAMEKIAYAGGKGIDVIVLDHHLIPAKLPKVSALVHTTHLASGGIAWFFSNYLLEKLSDYRRHSEAKRCTSYNLDLAAMATIADLVPLTGANRIIVKYGLEELNKTERKGLIALIKEAGLKSGEIGVYEVGHILAPRINALGRLTHALDALRLLCTKDSEKADILARQLSITNRERQLLTQESTLLAIEIVRHELTYSQNKDTSRLLFISRKEFKEGIIGLVAGKLVEEFHRPSIVIAERAEYSKASARSIPGLNIVELIREEEKLLEDVGGHPMAAGFTVATKNLDRLKKRLKEKVLQELDEDKLIRVLKIDTVLDFKIITSAFYKALQQLAPFGAGNPEPVFTSNQVGIVGVSLVGREKKHLKLKIRQNTTKRNSEEFDAIGFGMGDLYRKLSPGTTIDIVYTIDENKWNGNINLQLKIKDVKFQP